MRVWKDIVRDLDQRTPLPRLHPDGVWDGAISDEVLATAPAQLLGADNSPHVSVDSVRAGLLIWNDDVDAAHTIAQSMHDATGSYWHAIVHRREGDYDNSKYWFARVGRHPVFPAIHQQAARLWPQCQPWSSWSPDAFVDAVAEAVRAGEDRHPNADALRKIQVVEFSFLLRHGWTR